MQARLLASAICLLGTFSQAQAQDLGSVAAQFELSGIDFTLALNGAEALVKREGDRLVLSSPAKRDNFRNPDGSDAVINAPMLLSQIDNTQAFTLTARVKPSLDSTYDAGALYIWVREDRWLKMAMERDERQRTRLVSVRTEGTSDDNNHDVVTAGSVYMRISSDTRTVGFYYSLDNDQWQLIRLYRNAYPERIWLGISSQSPVGDGNTTTFDALSLTQTAIADFRLGK
jgi:regulation of enolase protein 1 (concanavalin A-like superfamily)